MMSMSMLCGVKELIEYNEILSHQISDIEETNRCLNIKLNKMKILLD